MGFWEDLGNAASSVASTVGDVVEDVVDVVTETAENVVNGVADTAQDGVNAVAGWLAVNGGPIIGGAATVVGGVVSGVIEGVQDLAVDVLNIVSDLGGVVGSLLRLDIPRLLEEFLNLGIDIGDLGLDLLRVVTGGYVVAGIVDAYQREDLRAFVRDLISTQLAGRPDLDAILARLNLGGGLWGLDFPAESRVMVLDTGTRGVADTVRAMHAAVII